MPDRQIVVYIATSADGYIARADGDVSWLDRPRTAGDYGMAAFYRSIDTVLWGRTTYDEAVKRGMSAGGFGGRVRNYVFTHRPRRSRAPGTEFVTGDISEFVKRLRAEPGRNVWMMGGSRIIASFLDVDGIDELIIHVIPVLIGAGIPLIAPRHRDVPLRLRGTRRYRDGVVRLHYEIDRHARRSAVKRTLRRSGKPHRRKKRS